MDEINQHTTALLRRFGELRLNESLATYSRWRIGGNADCVIVPDSIESIAGLVKALTEREMPYIVVGSSSNLLFADEGLRAIIIILGNRVSDVSISGNRVIAECGVWVPGFAKRVADAGLEGVQHMAGIPGTLGGLICMNGGSQRKGVGEQVVSVTAVTPEGELRNYTKEECQFAYRESIFQKNRNIVLSAEFEYAKSKDKAETKREMLEILRSRRLKFPLKLPNCGSVFVSNPAMYADYGPPGAVIERCGLKGFTRNHAQISPAHANFIVNNGGATATDVLYLIHLARRTVAEETGYLMPAEARFVTPEGGILPAHEMAERLYN